ncbi:hypothetical protein niasHS_000604 [Heterodera schachtii]|uniref:tRNA-binding domain-containing protein n=2 Tax=Heterodera TaxID=34509 RepID=A0ABD2K5H3_HETSC
MFRWFGLPILQFSPVVWQTRHAPIFRPVFAFSMLAHPFSVGNVPMPSKRSVDFGRLDVRVGRVVAVRKHPNADSLYVAHVELAELQPRTVIAGLVKFVGLEELQNRLVVCLCNLRPSKKRGIDSHAMILCASTEQKVEPLELSDQSSPPGSLIICPNFARQPDKVLKKSIWEEIALDMLVSGTGECVFKGTPLRVDAEDGASSLVTAPTLRNVPVK